MVDRRVLMYAGRSAAAAMVAGALLAFPGSVSAAAAPGTAYVSGATLYFQAGAAASNYIVVSNSADNVLLLQDNNQPIRLDPARSGACAAHDSQIIRCPGVTAVVAYLGDGRDYFYVYRNVTTEVYGQDGNDELWGWFDTDRFYGGPGDDLLEGLPGNDVLVGDAGTDTLNGDDGTDQLTGGDGNDTLYGGHHADHLHGGGGVDRLSGGYGNDTLNGGSGFGPGGGAVDGDAGDDILMWDSISRTFRGGEGLDTIDYSRSDRKVAVLLDDFYNDYALPHPTGEANPQNVHSDIEQVVGTAYNDLIAGNDLPNALVGGGGNDRIFAEGGDDYIDVQGGGTAQWAYGGEGRDTCTGTGLAVADSCEG